MSGKVVSLTDYGAFVELEPGVEGLIHVSEMSWSKRVKHPSKILNVGDSVEAMVLGVDPTARRISLGLKQVESNPWHELGEKYPVGTKIKGKVRNLTEFGAFVEVEEDIDGLIHISDMTISGAPSGTRIFFRLVPSVNTNDRESGDQNPGFVKRPVRTGSGVS